MPNDPTLPAAPITHQQFQSYVDLLNDPAAIGDVPLSRLYQMQAEMDQFEQSQRDLRDRLTSQGLSNEQVDTVVAAQASSEADPNAALTQPGSEEFATQTIGRDLRGLREGATQAVEGVLDLAMDISVSLNLDDEERREEWKESVRQRRENSRVEQVEEMGRLPGSVFEFAGEVVPWIFASTGSSARFLTFLGRNAMIGGTATASTFQPSDKELDDRTWNAVMGAGFGSLFAAPFGAGNLVRRSAARGLVRAFNEADPRQREAVELMVREMTGDPDFTFSAAQLTGTRFYNTMEASAADLASRMQQNRNLDILVRNVMRLSRQQSGAGRSAGEIALTIRDTLRDARRSIYQQAQTNWSSAARNLIEEYGDDAAIDGTAYLNKVDDLINEQTNTLRTTGAAPSENLIRYRAAVDEVVNPHVAVQRGESVYVLNRRTNERTPRILASSPEEAMRIAADRARGMNEVSGVTGQDSLDILAGLNELIGGEGAIFENATARSNRTTGRALMGAFTAEMDSHPANIELVEAIATLRQGYRTDIAAAEAIDRSVFNAMFGGRKLPTNAGDRLDTLMRGEPEDLVALREFLEEWNPELLTDLRSTALNRVVARSTARANAPDVDGQIDFDRLANELTDSFGRQGRLGEGLFDASTRNDIELTASALRILANRRVPSGPSFGGIRPEEWSINLISRSPEFFGRFVTRLMSSGDTLETALLNPEWRHALRIIAQEDLSSPTAKGALLYLATWMRGAGEEQAHIDAQRRNVAEAQAFAADPARGGTVQ